MRIDTYKEQIKKSLKNGETKFTVAYYDAQSLFDKVLAENPSLASSVERVSFSRLLLGGVFTVGYASAEKSAGGELKADTADRLEEIMHESVRKYLEEVEISVAKKIDVNRVFSEFMTAYEGFYSNLISVECRQRIPAAGGRKTAVFSFKYRIGRVKLTMMETAVNKRVDELSGTLFCEGMTDETKAFVAHNYLAKTVSYWLDKDAKPLERSYMQSAYGALINKKCVCQGYAEAYKRILDSQNIVCEVVCGKIKGTPEHHAWNVVSFDGKQYYHVDVTWDAQRSGSDRYKYYGLTDDEMKKDRIWTRAADVVCNGKDNIREKARLQLARRVGEFAAKGADREYFN